MPILLRIDSSPMGETSISRQLTGEFTQKWLRANPQGKLITRDLTTITIPVIDSVWIAANKTPKESRTEQQNDLLRLSSEFTAELLDADEYVIGLPMHNWGPSASFKLWMDQIIRIGETVFFTPSGLKGMLDKKQVTVFISAGRSFVPVSLDAPSNYLEPWLRTFFGNLGVKNMRFFIADGTNSVNYGKMDRVEFLLPHIDAIQKLFTVDQSCQTENVLIHVDP